MMKGVKVLFIYWVLAQVYSLGVWRVELLIDFLLIGNYLGIDSLCGKGLAIIIIDHEVESRNLKWDWIAYIYLHYMKSIFVRDS